MMKFLLQFYILFFLIFSLASCEKKQDSGRFKVVATTTMIADLVKNIGKDSIEVVGLMKAGVDPHLYKASEGDVTKLTTANAIFYNGLHLEGKMVDVFEKMQKSGFQTFAISNGIPKENLVSSVNFSGNYDPHIWFSVENWKFSAQYISKKLSELKPDSKSYFDQNLKNYLTELNSLENQLKTKAETLPKEKRILITAHDAFEYFGREYDFEVVGLQGISTASEAGTKDLLELANIIVNKKVPAVFIESSVPQRTVLALQKAVESKGKKVKLGGTLYSDALGNPNSPQGTYIGMYQSNMETIVKALHDK